MASDTGKQIGSVIRGDTFGVPPEGIVIRQEDPSHPLHKSHMARVDPKNPEFVALLEGMRTLGWPTGSFVFIFTEDTGETFKDENGKTQKRKLSIAATGKRRITAARIVNEEWRKAKDPRYPIVVPCVITKDPIMAENIENSYRAADPPLVRARRFLTSVDVLGAQAAAASNGFSSVKEAEAAVELLKEDPDLQGAVNRLEVPLGLAAAASKLGREKAKEALAEATDPKTGRIDGKKLKSAVKTAKKTAAATNGKRIKIMSGKEVVEIRKTLAKAEIDQKFVALLDYLLGKKNALDGYPALHKAIVGDLEQA